MADEYLELHKLQETMIPFAVERIIDEDLQASPECQLPDDNPLDLEFPALEPLPDVVCDYNVEIPLIPLPYFCTPLISGSITFTSDDESITIEEVDPISFEPSGECDFTLDGTINITACAPVYMAVLETDVTITPGVTVAYGIRWQSTCAVTINGVPFSSVGLIAPASPGTYNFIFTCCDGPHNQSVVVPAGGSFLGVTCEDITLDTTNNGNTVPGSEGEIHYNGTIVGTITTGVDIDATSEDCALELSYNSGSFVDITQGLVMSIENNVTLGCTTTADDTIFLTYTPADGSLTIEGTAPKMCFGCDVGDDGTFKENMQLGILQPTTIDFNNPCCTNTYGGWFECGKRVEVGDTGALRVTLNASSSDAEVVVTNSDATITVTTLDLTGTNREARFRELELCVDGDKMKFWVLCTEPEEA
jgi:hypothetical protein